MLNSTPPLGQKKILANDNPLSIYPTNPLPICLIVAETLSKDLLAQSRVPFLPILAVPVKMFSQVYFPSCSYTTVMRISLASET